MSTSVPIGEPALADPTSCGEDIARNAELVFELAPRLCRGCEDYHLLVPLRRMANRFSGVSVDRPKMIDIVKQLAASRGDGPIDVLIVGSADSGLLATCAHAAQRAGEGTLRRTRFTILDRCETPLELCRDFARRHDLALTTEAVDLVTTTRVHAADIIVHHSLFNHLPPESRVDVLRKLGWWLKPGGRIVFASSINSSAERKYGRSRRTEVNDLVLSMIESGAIRPPESKGRLQARLGNNLDRIERLHPDDYSTDQLRDLFVAAGLHVASFERIVREIAMPSGRSFVRERVMAVLTCRAADVSGSPLPARR
jgi:hypothetical protein